MENKNNKIGKSYEEKSAGCNGPLTAELSISGTRAETLDKTPGYARPNKKEAMPQRGRQVYISPKKKTAVKIAENE